MTGRKVRSRTTGQRRVSVWVPKHSGGMSAAAVAQAIARHAPSNGAAWAGQIRERSESCDDYLLIFPPGEDFVARMEAALQSVDRVLAVCTEAYFASVFGGAELRAAFAQSASAQGRIVPVLVEPVPLPALYASLISLDLTGLDETAAAARLRANRSQLHHRAGRHPV